MTAFAGCLGSDDRPLELSVRNWRGEPIEPTARVERWGDVGGRCDPRRKIGGDSTTATVEPDEKAKLGQITEQGLYGTVFEFDGEEHRSCLEYTGNEDSFAWVVDAETVNFVSHTR